MRRSRLRAAAALALVLALPVFAADDEPEEQPRPGFGGPNAVDNQLLLDKEAGKPLLDRIADWKAGMKERHGADFGLDYTAAYFGADESPGDGDAGSGLLRVYGTWDLVGREGQNTGSLVWKVEHRHAYTDLSLFDFGFNIGYAGFIEPPEASELE